MRSWLANDETFLFPYGVGVAEIDIGAAIRFHESHGKLATTVRTPARFGRIGFEGDQVANLNEKPQTGEGWMVREGQMVGYKHNSFWSCMDSQREKTYLADLWQSGKAQWKTW